MKNKSKFFFWLVFKKKNSAICAKDYYTREERIANEFITGKTRQREQKTNEKTANVYAVTGIKKKLAA